jgi:hypothetical protein
VSTPIKLSPVSLTPAINPCHGFSVIAGVVDTGDKFIAGDNDTGDHRQIREDIFEWMFITGVNADKIIAGVIDTGD